MTSSELFCKSQRRYEHPVNIFLSLSIVAKFFILDVCRGLPQASLSYTPKKASPSAVIGSPVSNILRARFRLTARPSATPGVEQNKPM